MSDTVSFLVFVALVLLLVVALAYAHGWWAHATALRMAMLPGWEERRQAWAEDHALAPPLTDQQEAAAAHARRRYMHGVTGSWELDGELAAALEDPAAFLNGIGESQVLYRDPGMAETY